MQGHRDLLELARLILGELTPLTSAQYGAIYLANDAAMPRGQHQGFEFTRIATYGFMKGGLTRFAAGEGLAGQAAIERTPIVISDAPAGYLKVGSGLGQAAPVSVAVLPILFEDQVLGVLEIASLTRFSDVHLAFFDQFVGTIGVAINTIMASSRTESLLSESQRLTTQLQERSVELQRQQAELRRSNAELEEKAALLAKQNSAIEVQNRQIEQARQTLEERAQQLAISSRYKSDFLANMSHELRTPLNSLLVLAKLLSENQDGNLTGQQVDFARTIHAAGSDLLQLINDILDLSKVEAGKMDVNPADLQLAALIDYVDATFRPMAEDQGPRLQRRSTRRHAGLPLRGRAAARADPAQPAVQRGQVHLGRRSQAHDRAGRRGGVRRRAPRRIRRRRVRRVRHRRGHSEAQARHDLRRVHRRPTGRPAAATAGPASACRSAATSPGCSAGRSARPAGRARAARSRCTCRPGARREPRRTRARRWSTRSRSRTLPA